MQLDVRKLTFLPACAVGLGALLTVSPLAAQSLVTFEAWAARKERPTSPLFGGISLAGYKGPLGVRLSGGLHYAHREDSSTQAVYDMRCRRLDGRRQCGPRSFGGASQPHLFLGAWSADADVIVEPLRTVPALRALLLGFSPYAFAGIGGYGVRPSNGPDTSIATWSLGAGVHHTLLGWLGLGAEARYRRPLRGDSARFVIEQRKLEYRLGLTVSFGEHRSPTRGRDVGAAAPRPAHGACGAAPCTTDSARTDESRARLAARVLDRADGYVDTPFRRGGASPETGFDGAGFVQYVFGREGVRLPRSARQMADVGTEVTLRIGSLRPGDLLFFASDGSHVDHVAIYAGRERIIHSSASGGGVRYDDLGAGGRGQWFADHLVAARRVAAADGGSARSRGEPPDDEEESDRPDRAPRPAPR